jgi:predicted Zn-dependent peptidase
MPRPGAAGHQFRHALLDCGVEVAVDRLPERNTVALSFRMLTGMVDDPPELTGISSIVEHTLSKGTRRFDGRGLADAFDQLGAQWTTFSGRQSTLVQVLCLPEFARDVVELVTEMIRYPTFPDEACQVAIELAQQELRQMEDEPQDLLRVMIQALTLGPVLGRHPGGTPESLARLTPDLVRAQWRQMYHGGRLQVAAAGPLEPERFVRQIEQCFAGFGSAELLGRSPADFVFRPGQQHRMKELEQQYLAITLPGVSKDDPAFPVEQVLLGVFSGGMSARLFTEVREKQGLVYWISAWHEQPRGRGVIHVGASTRPERCDRTYQTLLRELHRVGEDLTSAETARARDGLIAQLTTEDDLTRSHATELSDDLFHVGRPIGQQAKLDALQQVTVEQVVAYARQLPLEQLCIASLGPRDLWGA